MFKKGKNSKNRKLLWRPGAAAACGEVRHNLQDPVEQRKAGTAARGNLQ